MAEPITFKCFKCKGDVTVDAALSGFTVACPYCETTLTVPVMMQPAAQTHQKIKLKKDMAPGHLKVESPDMGGAEEEPQEEVEYIIVDEPSGPPVAKIVIGIGVVVLILLICVAAFFGVKSYNERAEQARIEQAKAQEAAAKAAELAAKEARLKPVWDDAKALAERTHKDRTNIENTIRIFEGLKERDFAGTKFAKMAETELQRLNILKDSVEEELRKAKEAADAAAAEAAKQKATQQTAQKGQPAKPQPKQPDPAAEKKAAADRLANLLKALTKHTIGGEWQAAATLLAAFPDKEPANALKPIFDLAVNQDKAVLSTLKEDEGKELQIALKSGSETLKVISVRNNIIQTSQKFDKATIQKNFTDDDLAPAERAARVARVNPETGTFLQLAADCSKQDFDTALKTLNAMQIKSKFSEALRNSIKADVYESAAEDGYERLLAKLHIKASMTPIQMTAEIAKLRVTSQAEKEEVKALIPAYRDSYKNAKLLKTIAPKLDSIAKALNALPISKAPASSSSGFRTPGLGGKPAFK